MRRIIILTLVVVVCGCSSIPISTAFRFQGFEEEDFLALEGSEIRARVSVADPVELNPSGSRLTLDLETENGETRREFGLQPISESLEEVSGGLFRSPSTVHVYLLSLDEEGQTAFRDFQSRFSDDQIRRWAVQINTRFQEVSEDVDSIRLWIDMRLHEDEEFFTLIDGADIEIDREESEVSD